MKKLLIAIGLFGILGIYSCDIDQTKEGELPSVDIDVDTKSGTMPEFDIDWMSVDVGTRTKTVTVPRVEIVMEEVEVDVPYISAEWPEDYGDVQDQTLMVEAEVTEYEYDINIESVYATGDRLYVISKLDKKDKKIGDKSMRVSDQIVINAPDLTVKHYILGDKPSRGFNNNYTYISSKDKISRRIKGAKKIYG